MKIVPGVRRVEYARHARPFGKRKVNKAARRFAKLWCKGQN
jgi:hypothetical protein